MSGKYDKDPSVILANDLLGRVISYNGKNYMITVTEAYPYNEEKSNDDKEIGYVKAFNTGDAKDILTNDDNIGKFFVWSGLLHVVSGGGEVTVENKKEYMCGNVLIRGGIELTNNGFAVGYDNDITSDMSFIKGQPSNLAEKMDLSKRKGIVNIFLGKKHKTVNKRKERIGIDSNEKLRFYVKELYAKLN